MVIRKDLSEPEESNSSDSEIEIIAEVLEQPLAKQPTPSHRHKDKRKHGASDVSRDQASAEEAPSSRRIEDHMEEDEQEAKKEGEEAEEEEEEEGEEEGEGEGEEE